MFKLRTGYFICGLTTGLVLLFSFLSSLPDKKLHIVFCDVGQGDAAYIRLPDGRDILVDGGPSDRVLECLGGHMPFWDRSLDMVMLTHPQKDHMQGLLSVIERYQIGYIIRTDVMSASEGFARLRERMKARHIPEKLVAAGEVIRIGRVRIMTVWPSSEQLARMRPNVATADSSVLGSSDGDLNDGSLVFWLRFGSFDALFPGDADAHTEGLTQDITLADSVVELLKVPHHGSKTGITKERIDKLKPKLSIISVGKNSYGHPAPELLSLLADESRRVLRTDQEGDIEVVSDGSAWYVR